MTKVINLFSGPGAGKSTIAAELFAIMKWHGFKVELVTEFAKDKVWENHLDIFEDQLYIIAKQNRRLHRLISKVDYIITDSPLMLSMVYSEDELIKTIVPTLFAKYDNHNYFINRQKPYMEYGRMQTEDEARIKDMEIGELLDEYYLTAETIQGDRDAAQRIFSHFVMHGGTK